MKDTVWYDKFTNTLFTYHGIGVEKEHLGMLLFRVEEDFRADASNETKHNAVAAPIEVVERFALVGTL